MDLVREGVGKRESEKSEEEVRRGCGGEREERREGETEMVRKER